MKVFTSFVLLLILCAPGNVFAGHEELQAIIERDATNKFYERAVEFFTKKMPDVFEARLSNSNKYMSFIMDIFIEKGIPTDIAYLPLIESGFSPLSVGPGNTAGLWQFVSRTARNYGLRVDRYVDERMDPIKSTNAAADYLADLYSKFGAWDIALAAYNMGEGKIKHIFSRRDKSERLPAVTNRYLAYFMAAATLARDPEKYGFDLPHRPYTQDLEFREIMTNKSMSLKELAEEFNTTVQEIRVLNPALLKDKTPPYSYMIRLPNN